MDFALLSSMPPITLEEMDAIRLMNRVDTKYLTGQTTLESVLEDVARDGFFVFEIAGHRICKYDSLYYDTPGYGMYLDHHNRRLTRQKVRTRMYNDTQEAYLEIKLKNNRGRTRKKRIGIACEFYEGFAASPESSVFIEKYSSLGIERLSPSVVTSFRRITLVDSSRRERITIDTDVQFTNKRNGNVSGLGNAVIIEIKQDGLSRSRMREILLEHRVKPFRISKYCMGVAMTEPMVKRNRFLGKIRTIIKINKSNNV